ncbi:MAG: VOC family protein [Ginsengibacter sp.]
MNQEIKTPNNSVPIATTIVPWLSVSNSVQAVDFYKSAFGAIEVYRLEMDSGAVVRLSINGAEFWVSSGSSENENPGSEISAQNPVRLILTVSNPDAVFARALEAGASEVFPVGEEHGWRLGRLIDPTGLHWEIGHPIT